MNDISPPLSAFLAPARAPKGARRETMDLIAKVAGGALVRDLVFLAPNSAIDRRKRVPIADTEDGDIATIEAEVDGHMAAYKNLPHRIRLRDETGFMTVAYFRGHEEMLKRPKASDQRQGHLPRRHAPNAAPRSRRRSRQGRGAATR
jgi:RecG-like helicase